MNEFEVIYKSIFQTKDYNQFVIVDKNRDLSKKHVNKLVNSIKKYGYKKSCPILVNDKLEVIDGQHRIEACKILNIPVLYTIEDLSIKDISTLNSCARNWKMNDYVKFHSDREEVKFLIYLNETYNIDYSSLFACFCSKGRGKRNSTVGEAFETKLLFHSYCTYEYMEEFCKHVKKIYDSILQDKSYKCFFVNSTFCQALYHFYRNTDIETFQEVVKRIIQYVDLIPSVRNPVATRKKIADIYNYNRKSNRIKMDEKVRIINPYNSNLI